MSHAAVEPYACSEGKQFLVARSTPTYASMRPVTLTLRRGAIDSRGIAAFDVHPR